MNRDHLRRGLILLAGLLIMSIGVGFSIKAEMGISPVSCVPYVLSLMGGLSMGQLTALFNILIVLAQIVLPGKRRRLVLLVQIPVVVLFGVLIDFSLYLMRDLEAASYLSRFMLMIASCVTLGIGVFLEIRARITFLPGEGLAMVLTDLLKKEFGKTKVAVDTSMVVLGIAISLILFGKVFGVREGTVISAVLIGSIVRFLGKLPVPGAARPQVSRD